MPRSPSFLSRFDQLVYLVAAMGAFEFVNQLMGHRLLSWGIRPRTLEGLRGIPLSPFLHAGIGHLLVNVGPLLILGGLTLVSDRRRFPRTTLAIICFAGLGIWLVGRAAHHVGASALVFGYFGFLLARGWLQRRPGALIIALLVVTAYGGMFWGLLPTSPHISWEGHACGLAAGIMTAWIDARPRR